MARIDILLPTYNKPLYFREALQSIMAQTFDNFTLTIWDNSDDKYLCDYNKNVVQEYSDERVNYQYIAISNEYRQKSGILASLINRFYGESTAEFVYYLNDDDIMLPHCLSTMVNFIDKYQVMACYHSQLVQGGYIDEQGRGHWWDWGVRHADEIIPINSNVCCKLDGLQVFFKSTCLHHVSQPYWPCEVDLSWCADGMFNNKLLQYYPFYPMNEILTVHRHTPISHTAPIRRGAK